MALPLNISELLHGKVVEWERLEFKEGWNPESVLHSVCAFANDINNWGGGYIIIGIRAVDGIPQFPASGLPLDSLDRIQGELIGICYKIQPNYLPITQPYEIDGKQILVVWCPAGDMRPYSCPSTLGNDARRQYYIRSGSRSIVAQGDNQTRLIELTAKVPFDDRINQEAKINDLELGLIREFLQEVGSDLFEESTSMPFADLCKAMHIVRGPIESLRPVNGGLLFFNSNPHRFFNRAWIELVIHQDDSGRNFRSQTFMGPLHKQIRNCLAFLRSELLKTETQKVMGQAESVTTSNYPYNALEEAICNAVYHKSYSEEKPIEIQVLPNCIEILSYPGPLPPIKNADLQERRVIARDYRNRRIGDFLKELKLTEGKATGIPVIRDGMAKNGNPEPLFYTDEESILFLVTLPIHSSFEQKLPFVLNVDTFSKDVAGIDTIVNQLLKYTDFHSDVDNSGGIGSAIANFYQTIDNHNIETITTKDGAVASAIASALAEFINNIDNQVVNIEGAITDDTASAIAGAIAETLSSNEIKALELAKLPQKRETVLVGLGVTNHRKNYDSHLFPLVTLGWLTMTLPHKPTSPNQQYLTTLKGRLILEFLKRRTS